MTRPPQEPADVSAVLADRMADSEVAPVPVDVATGRTGAHAMREAVDDVDERSLPQTDPLTGLARRALLLDRLDKALARRHMEGGHVVVFHIELNNFGYVHDQLGTQSSNAILREISRRLVSLLRSEDTVGRIGDSELVIAVSLPEESLIEILSGRIGAAFEDAVVLHDREVTMWTTLVSLDAKDVESAEDLLARLELKVRRKAPHRRPRGHVWAIGRPRRCLSEGRRYLTQNCLHRLF
jgi:diguanylate cyclase (GGDEF)-like protein